MFRSKTFSDDLNLDEPKCKGGSTSKIFAIFGFCVVEFLLSSVFFCYGVLLSAFVEYEFYSLEDGLWAIIIFVTISGISDPWTRYLAEHFIENGYDKMSILFGTTCLTAGFILCSVDNNAWFQIIIYGTVGGAMTNLISSILKIKMDELFDLDTNMMQQITRSLSLFSMPHLLLILIDFYGVFESQFIFGAILYHIIPASLIIQLQTKNKKKDPTFSRYEAFPVLVNQITEMTEIVPPRINEDLNEMNTDYQDFEETITEAEEGTEENGEFFKYETVNEDEDNSDDEIVNEENVKEDSGNALFINLNPMTVQSYYMNAGVNILPKIPEEDEIDEMDNDINKINLKRLSRISTKLEELSNKISKDKKEDSGSRDSLLFGSKHQIDKISEDPPVNNDIEKNLENDKPFFKQMKRNNKISSCCTPYRKYKWRRRLRKLNHFFLDNFLKPLYSSIKNPHFYPPLLSKISTTVISAVFLTLVPNTALEKNSNFTTLEATLLLSYIAFSWCLFFLVGLPLLHNFSNTKVRIMFIFGLIISGLSMILLFTKFTNDVLTLSCLLFGFGYGCVSYLEMKVYRSFIGSQNWSKIQGTLETLTAIFVIIIYFVIYSFNINRKLLLFITCITYSVNALLWFVAPIFKCFANIVISRFRSRQDSFLY